MDRATQELAAKYNARLLSEGKTGMRWVVDASNELRLMPADRREYVPPPPAEEDRLL